MTLAERIAAELHRVSTDRYMFGLFGDGRMGSGGFGKLQILGKTKHVTRCQNCGRAGLKHAVVCAVVGEDGHPTNQYYYFGTDCAAKLAGKPEKDVEAEAEHQESSGRPRMKNIKPAKPNEGQMELGLRFAAYLHDLITERYARAKASKGQMGFDFDALASAPQSPAPVAQARPAASEPPALPVKGKQMGLFDQPEQPKTVASGNATKFDEEKHPRWEAGDKQHHGGQFAPKESKSEGVKQESAKPDSELFADHFKNGRVSDVVGLLQAKSLPEAIKIAGDFGLPVYNHKSKGELLRTVQQYAEANTPEKRQAREKKEKAESAYKTAKTAFDNAMANKNGLLGAPINFSGSDEQFRNPHAPENRDAIQAAWREEVAKAFSELDPEHADSIKLKEDAALHGLMPALQSQEVPKPQYFKGDQIRLTGKTDGDFEEFEYLEGHKKGQTGLRLSPAASAAQVEQRKQEWKDQQAQFARLHQKQEEPKAAQPAAGQQDATGKEALLKEYAQAVKAHNDLPSFETTNKIIELRRKYHAMTGRGASLDDDAKPYQIHRPVKEIEKDIAKIQQRLDTGNANRPKPLEGGTRARSTTFNANQGKNAELLRDYKSELKNAQAAAGQPEQEAPKAAEKSEPHLEALRGLVGDEHYNKIAGEFDRAFKEFDTLPQDKKDLEYRANQTRSKALQTELGAKVTYAGLRVGLLGDGMEKLVRGMKQGEQKPELPAQPKAAEPAAPSQPAAPASNPQYQWGPDVVSVEPGNTAPHQKRAEGMAYALAEGVYAAKTGTVHAGNTPEALRKRITQIDAINDAISKAGGTPHAYNKAGVLAEIDKLEAGAGNPSGVQMAQYIPPTRGEQVSGIFNPQPAQSMPAASGGAVAPESQPAESVGSRVAAAITKRSMDFGRKVEVRKDRAKSTGPKAKKQVGEWDLDEGWAKRYQITQVASSKDPSEVGKFIITDKKQKGPWYAKDQGVQVGGQYSSAEEAKQALPLIEVARNHRVYEGRDGKWHIYRKLGDRHHVSVKSFPSQEEAMKYMAMNPREIIGHKFPRYETYQYLTEVERKGPERRKGTVNEQDFQKAFAPGGAVFGNWMTNKDGVTAFHHAYDSLHDLADVLDLHPHQVSIDGDLVFGFGAAGSGGKDAARAHYEPGQRLINLTKMAGAGSLAHEWWHALEHHIAKKLGASEHTAVNLRPSAMKNDPELAAAVEELHDAMHYSNDEGANKAELQRVAEAQERRKQKLADTNREARENGTTVYDPQGPEDFLHNIRLGMQRTLSYKKKEAKPELMKQYEEIESKLKAGDLGERAGSTTHGFVPIYANIQALSDLHKKITGRGLLAKDAEGDKWLRRIYWDNLKLEKPKTEAAKVENKPKRTVRSKFKIEADKLDHSRSSPYYGLPHEMAARAFEAYVEDKLKKKGIQSDYLVGQGKTDSAFYKAFGLDAPFPEGDERKQINAAFDRLLAAVRKHLRKPETERHGLADEARELSQRVQRIVERYSAAHGFEELLARAAKYRVKGQGYNRNIHTSASRLDDMLSQGRHKEAAHWADELRLRLDALEPKPATDLLGQPVKPAPKPKAVFDSTKGKQQTLFAGLNAKEGQMNLFADAGVPDDLVAKPQQPAQKELFSAIRDALVERYDQSGDRQPKFRIDAGMKAAAQQTPPSTKPPAIFGAIGGLASKAGNWLQDKADKVAGKIGGAAQKLDQKGQAAMAKVGLADKVAAPAKPKSAGVKAGAPLMFNGDHSINGGQTSIPKGTQGKLVGPHQDPKNVVVDVGGQHHVVPKSLLLHDLRHTDHKAVEKSKQEAQQAQSEQQAKVRQMTARQRAEAVPEGADKAKLKNMNIGSHELQVGDIVNHSTPGLHAYGRVLEVSPDGKKIKIEEAARSKGSPGGIATTGRHVWIDGHEKIGDTGAVGTRSFPVLRTPDEYRPIGERKEYKEAYEGAKKLGLNDDQAHEMAMQMWDDLQAKNNPKPQPAPAAQQPAQAQPQAAQAKPAGAPKPRHHAESLQAGDTLRMLKGSDTGTNLKFIGRSKQPGMVEVEHPTLGRQTFRSRDLGLYVPGQPKAAGPSFTDQMKKGYDRSSPDMHTVKRSEFAGQKHGVLAKDQQGRGFLLYGGKKYALSPNEFDGKKLIGDNPGVKIRERIHREQIQTLASKDPSAVPAHVREEYDHHWDKWTGDSPFAKSGGKPAKGPAQVPQEPKRAATLIGMPLNTPAGKAGVGRLTPVEQRSPLEDPALQEQIQERAAIMEHEGGYDPQSALRLAIRDAARRFKPSQPLPQVSVDAQPARADSRIQPGQKASNPARLEGQKAALNRSLLEDAGQAQQPKAIFLGRDQFRNALQSPPSRVRTGTPAQPPAPIDEEAAERAAIQAEGNQVTPEGQAASPPPTQPAGAASAPSGVNPQVAQRQSPNLRALVRPFQAGRNMATMQFADELQRDLHDYAAAQGRRRQFSGKAGRQQPRQAAQLESTLNRIAADHFGGDKDAAHLAALQTLAHVKAHMRGVGDGQHKVIPPTSAGLPAEPKQPATATGTNTGRLTKLPQNPTPRQAEQHVNTMVNRHMREFAAREAAHAQKLINAWKVYREKMGIPSNRSFKGSRELEQALAKGADSEGAGLKNFDVWADQIHKDFPWAFSAPDGSKDDSAIFDFIANPAPAIPKASDSELQDKFWASVTPEYKKHLEMMRMGEVPLEHLDLSQQMGDDMRDWEAHRRANDNFSAFQDALVERFSVFWQSSGGMNGRQAGKQRNPSLTV